MDERPPPATLAPAGRWWLAVGSWRPGASWLVLAVCLAGTYAAWRVTRGQAEERAHDRFRARVERISQDITNRILAYDQVLKGAAGLYAASVSVERHEWRAYVESVGIEEHYPGIRGLGFIQFVPESRRENFLRETRNDFPRNYPVRSFDITPAGARAQYLVVTFLEPIARNNNLNAFGYDIGVDDKRRAAAERARDTDAAALTPRLTLRQSAAGVPGVLLLRPIYANSLPRAALIERRAALQGWVYAAFQMAELMTNLIGNGRSEVDFEIFDGTGLAEDSLLYDDDGVRQAGAAAPPGVLRTNLTLDVVGRPWTVHFRARPGFARGEAWNKPRFVGLAGVCMSLLFFGIVRAATSTQARARRLADDITRRLRVQEQAINSSISGITILDATKPDLPAIYVNPAVERMTGYTADEILRQKSSVIVGPDCDQPGVAALREAVREGREARAVLRCFRKDGTAFWNEISLAPLRDRYGRVTHFVSVSMDITERMRAEESLRLVSNRLMLATRAASLGVWDWDIVHDKLVWDEAMYRIYGVAPDQFSGAYEAWESCVHPEDKQRATEELQQALRGEKEFHTEFRVIWPDQSVHYIMAHAVVLRDGSGQAIQILGINADVTARRRAKQELEHARLAAEAASRAKSEFVANMSHEIRTPLNAVLGMTDLALDTALNAEQRGYLTAARQSAADLLALVNDVLDFSKIEAGKLELTVEPFGLRALLAQWLQPFVLRAREKGVGLSLRVADAVPDALLGDAAHLRQVIVNLVGNAVKFTARGEVSVEVRLAPAETTPPSADAPPVTLEFLIADTGLGIAKEKQRTIFEAFMQADSSITRSYGGTGLGLAISRRLVALMGGRLWVESEPGRGSRFYFTVTLQAAPAAARGAAPQLDAPPPALLTPALRVLVAEDNRVNAELLGALLRKLGHAVEIAANGHDALAACERQVFDLVLMDLQMPGLDGFAATARLRERERGSVRRTPIIAVTAHALAGTRAQCLAAGMDGYISKPIERAALLAAIEGCLPGATPPAAAPATPGSGERLVQQLNGDVQAARKLISLFLETTPPLLAELRAALATGDVERLRRAAHTLKGSVTQLGDAPARAAALDLENCARTASLDGTAPALSALEAQVARLTGELHRLLDRLPAG